MNPNPDSSGQTEAELESFRQKWREEVSARSRAKAATPAAPSSTHASSSKAQAQKSLPSKVPLERLKTARTLGTFDDVEPRTYHDLEEKETDRTLAEPSSSQLKASKEPRTALEHYERAVEREGQGQLGDSVDLYRKAFKLDSRVHEQYKKKHFAAFWAPKPANPNPFNPPVTVPNTAHHSLQGLSTSFSDLITEFSRLSIPGEVPPTELSPPPPCPIASLPEELLAEILLYVAIEDIASFSRLALVCKRLAYLVFTEERIWRRIALGHEYGFAAMHYDFACQINGTPLGDDDSGGHLLSSYDPDFDSEEAIRAPLPLLPASTLVPSPYPTYRNMFRTRPRIRFNGCYISTVNYIRPGGASTNQMTWNSPVLIVTYYRYLRFFRDGTAISLLTTAEPADVVHHLQWEHMHNHHSGGLPSAVMKDALRGRWRLSGPDDAPESSDPEEEKEAEGTLHVETDGVTPKYIYKMALALGSAGRGARNNKLSWKGYWSYNKLTDDWAEFGLKNDRAYYWSRVKSYESGL